MSVRAGIGTTTSSSRAVEPTGRAPATAVYSPLRTSQASARSLGSVENPYGFSSVDSPSSRATTRDRASTRSSSSDAVSHCASTSRAVCASTRSPSIAGTIVVSCWATRRDAASISSAVAAPASTRAGRAAVAPSMRSKTSSEVASWE